MAKAIKRTSKSKATGNIKKGNNTPKKGTWFSKGAEGFKTKHKQDVLRAKRKETFAPRFWLEDGKDAKVIFLDSEGFFIWEHRIWMDKKPTYITCVRESTDCLVCADGIHILNSADRPQFVGYWTIIDTRTYESKGKTYKNEKRLLRVTGDSIRILEDFKAKQKDLTGLAVAIKRLGERSSAAGNHFDKIRKVDIKKKLGKEAAPFEYKKILAPLSEEDILEMGLGRPVSGSDADLGDVDVSIAEDIL